MPEMVNEKPAVSAIIPTYNRAHLVGRAIKSVLNQTYQDFELIVVDDCSTDSTEIVVKKFQGKDKRIKYFRHMENKGGCVARNNGIRNSKGKYIAFLDSDDEWLPAKLEKQLEVFEKSQDNKLGLVNCGTIYVDEGSKKEINRVLEEEKGDVFDIMLLHEFDTGGGSSQLIKKQVFDSIGLFDESEYLRKGGQQDYEMWLRISKRYHFDYVAEFLVNRYFHSENITTVFKKKSQVKAFEYIVDKYRNDYRKFPDKNGGYYRYVGTQYCIAGDIREGKKFFFSAMKIQPLNFRNYIHLLFSFMGTAIYIKFYEWWSKKILKRDLRK